MRPVFRAYFSLVKPGIILGNLITATAGFFVACRLRGEVNLLLYVQMLLGLSLILAAGCVFNNVLDREHDAKMLRTKDRALVQKWISPKQAFFFGLLLAIMGIGLFSFWGFWLPLVVGIGGLLIYVMIYTLLKPKTPYATLVGSISGATPPVIGYLVYYPNIDAVVFFLFAMLLAWQMPHFFAIALFREKEYEAAGLPVWPLSKGLCKTQWQMLLYVALFFLLCIAFALEGYASFPFLGAMTLLCAFWFFLSIRGLCLPKEKISPWARGMFFLSLGVIFAWSFFISFG